MDKMADNLINKQNSIQLLRAVLFSIVFLYHAGVTLFSWGWISIEAFFCISGYFVFGKLFGYQTKKNWGELFVRRVKRLLWPDYTILLIVSFLLFVMKGKIFLKSFLGYLLGVQNILWAIGKLGFEEHLAHLWTVSLEIQMLAIVIIGASFIKDIEKLPIVLCIASLGFIIISSVTFQQSFYISLNPLSHIFAFSMGGIVLLVSNKEAKTINGCFSLICISVGIIGIFILLVITASYQCCTLYDVWKLMNSATLDIHFSRLSYLIYVFGSLFFAGILRKMLEICNKNNVNGMVYRLIIKIGDDSYILYLFHYPIIRILHRVINSSIICAFCGFILLILVTILYKKIRGLMICISNA